MACGDSYGRAPHFEIILRERSLRTISDLVCRHTQAKQGRKTHPWLYRQLTCSGALYGHGTLYCHCAQTHANTKRTHEGHSHAQSKRRALLEKIKRK